jgi:hypothetical protein
MKLVLIFLFLSFVRQTNPFAPCQTYSEGIAVMKVTIWALLATQAAALGKPKHKKPLKFSKGGTFQIAIFEDLHYGEGKL